HLPFLDGTCDPSGGVAHHQLVRPEWQLECPVGSELMPRVVADVRIVLGSVCWIGQRPQTQIPAPAVSERSADALNRAPRRLSLEGVIVVGTPVGVIGD